MYLLEYNKMPDALSFHHEVNSLEFTGAIGEIDITCCGNPAARDKKLEKLGERLFAEWPPVVPPPPSPPFKLKRARKKIIRELSQKEIDRLLTAVTIDDKPAKGIGKYKNAVKRFLQNIRSIRIKKQRGENTGVLSQEEIDSLLSPLKGNEKHRS